MQPSLVQRYGELPERFFVRSLPATAPNPALICLNQPLAHALGLDTDWLESAQGVQMLAGRRLVGQPGALALAYAGHQFGHFVPELGDGRAVLLGEIVDRDGHRLDLQLKGSGRTPFSRQGDGRAPLGSVLREYLISQAMAALGILTTRSLAVIATGETLQREQAVPGGVLARIATSHVRIGTFEYLAARHDEVGLRLLANHVIARNFPQAAQGAHPYAQLLAAIVGAQARLVARWMLVGFVHGVLNTDNVSVAGETLDYGPCAFIDGYAPGAVYSSIDRAGRYAYARQTLVTKWNLSQLAQCLLPLISDDAGQARKLADEIVDGFDQQFDEAFAAGLRAKLGLASSQSGDAKLGADLLAIMAATQADFTATFRCLSEEDEQDRILSVIGGGQETLDWLSRWHARCRDEPARDTSRRAAMRQTNPAVIPRNHHVTAVIDAAISQGDYAPFRALLDLVGNPFATTDAALAQMPMAHERVTQTFCGT